MTAREKERAMLERCRQIALGLDVPRDPVTANVCRVAGSVIGTSYADAGMRLRAAAADYFSAHPADEVPTVEVVRRGWVITLPRLRNRLERLLAAAVEKDILDAFHIADRIATLLEVQPVPRGVTADQVQEWIDWWRLSYEVAQKLSADEIAACKSARKWPPVTSKQVGELPPRIAQRRIP